MHEGYGLCQCTDGILVCKFSKCVPEWVNYWEKTADALERLSLLLCALRARTVFTHGSIRRRSASRVRRWCVRDGTEVDRCTINTSMLGQIGTLQKRRPTPLSPHDRRMISDSKDVCRLQRHVFRVVSKCTFPFGTCKIHTTLVN